MKTEVNVSVKEVIKNNRVPFSGFAGKVFAQDVFKPQVRVMDPDYQAKIDSVKASGNGDLVLNRSPRRFSIYGVTVSALRLGTNINDEVVLIINEGTDDEMIVPYTCEKDFGKTDIEAIKEAIKNPDKNNVFSDVKFLGNAIIQLNNGEIARIDAMIKFLETAKRQCESAIGEVNNKVQTYLDQKSKSAKKAEGDVTVEVSTSIE